MKKYFVGFFTFWQEISLPLKIALVISLVISIALVTVGVVTRSIFTYDQARDALQAYSIWHDHNIKLLGPETDIPGVFHGVLWYYILALLYFVGRVPEFVIAVFSILSFGTVLIAGILTQKLFKNSVITAITVIFYSLSPLFQTTTRWVSNPVLAFLVTPILLLLLWNFLQKQKFWTAFWVGICFGVIIQGEFAFLLLLLAIPLYWIVFRWKVRVVDVSGFLGGLFLTTVSFFIAEIKFRGQAAKGIVLFLHEGSSSHNVVQIIQFMWGRILDLFSISFYPLQKVLLALLILVIFFVVWRFWKSEKRPLLFLLVWSCVLLFFLFFHVGISTSYFLFYPFLVPIVILVSFVLSKISKHLLLLSTVGIIVVLQVYSSALYLKTNTSPLPAQQGTTLLFAKKVIEYTYTSSAGKPFTISTVTNPLFINSTWSYLYTTYGLPKYHYVPNFDGRSQKDYLGFLPEKQFTTKDRYLIIEPTIGIPPIYIQQAIAEQEGISDIVETKHIGAYVIERRKLRSQSL